MEQSFLGHRPRLSVVVIVIKSDRSIIIPTNRKGKKGHETAALHTIGTTGQLIGPVRMYRCALGKGRVEILSLPSSVQTKKCPFHGD